MKAQKKAIASAASQLLDGLRTSDDEVAKLSALEQSGNGEKFARALKALDKREAIGGPLRLAAKDAKRFNASALQVASSADQAQQALAQGASLGPSLVAELVGQKKIQCDCLVPFTFAGLSVFGAMSGPDLTDVRQGLLGAIRLADNEYTISNPGNTTGTTRVHLSGGMTLSFSATLPSSGSYYLLMPVGNLWIHGHSRVVGHGNSTTSYDAKVWVWHHMMLEVGGRLVEMAGGQIHYDATRSEDRTKYFAPDLLLGPRYVAIGGVGAGEELRLTFRLDVDTAANEDGIAIIVVDAFGLPANTKRDYDTLAIAAG